MDKIKNIVADIKIERLKSMFRKSLCLLDQHPGVNANVHKKYRAVESDINKTLLTMTSVEKQRYVDFIDRAVAERYPQTK